MARIDSYDFKGKRALIRVDFNVPLDKNDLHVTDDTRIRAAKSTIDHILKLGGSVVLMTHLGRPKTKEDHQFSIKHIVSQVSKVLGVNVKFVEDCISEHSFQESANLKPGEVLLLENLRYYEEETKGDKDFAKKLA